MTFCARVNMRKSVITRAQNVRDVRDIFNLAIHVTVVRNEVTHISQGSSLTIICAHVAKVLLQKCARVAVLARNWETAGIYAPCEIRLAAAV